MLNDATGFEKIYIALGRTDLRRGIDGLAGIVKMQFNLDPFQKNVLFLFCGSRTDRIKGLVWEGDGFLLLYKRLECAGTFKWPRYAEEAAEITQEQLQNLMKGFEVIPIKCVTFMFMYISFFFYPDMCTATGKTHWFFRVFPVFKFVIMTIADSSEFAFFYDILL